MKNKWKGIGFVIACIIFWFVSIIAFAMTCTA